MPSPNYQLALLYLTHLLVGADGEIDENEMEALKVIRGMEKISDETFTNFTHDVPKMRERDIYSSGLDFITSCKDQEKLRAFAILYKLISVDGDVHIKEVRFLLYAAKAAGLNFDDVTAEAAKLSFP
ncbi:MAG TPA: hypothetical protein PKC24_00405 [Cyclobacteriaceae bacterium]|nr:hypothetical protein [Cyclobacteriaceae bacterium]